MNNRIRGFSRCYLQWKLTVMEEEARKRSFRARRSEIFGFFCRERRRDLGFGTNQPQEEVIGPWSVTMVLKQGIWTQRSIIIIIIIIIISIYFIFYKKKLHFGLIVRSMFLCLLVPFPKPQPQPTLLSIKENGCGCFIQLFIYYYVFGILVAVGDHYTHWMGVNEGPLHLRRIFSPMIFQFSTLILFYGFIQQMRYNKMG